MAMPKDVIPVTPVRRGSMPADVVPVGAQNAPPARPRPAGVPNIDQLPGYEKTQAKIAQRGSQWNGIVDIAKHPVEFLKKPGVMGPGPKLGLEAMGAAFRTLEQPVANAGMAMQEGRLPALMDLINGVTGKKPGELGDIYRQVGAPEPVAAAGGLLATMGVGGPAAGEGQKGVAKVASGAVDSVVTPIGPRLDVFIDKNIEKAIRPSFSGKTTPALLEKFKANARQAIKTIVQRKDALKITDEYGQATGKLPENLQQFVQGIDQIKTSLFNQYSDDAVRAGEFGAAVELAPIADDIVKQISNKSVQTLFPELVERTHRIADSLRNAKNFSPEEAQQAIEMLNASLKAFYKNPNPQAAAGVVVDAAIASKLRLGLDRAVDGLQGRYGDLKRQYGALRAIQDDVMKRALVDARKNNKGFFDLADVFAAGDIVKGLASLDPATFASGAVKRGMVNYIKNLNNPNRMIKGMFQVVDRAEAKIGRLKKIGAPTRLLNER